MAGRSWRKSKNLTSALGAAVCYFGMLLAAGMMIRTSLDYIHGSPGARYFGVIWFFTALGLGAGMLLVRLDCLETWTQPGWARSEIIYVAFFGIYMAKCSYRWGMCQFGGFDQAGLIDMAWRLYCGQRPYVDFACTMPVGFYAGAGLAFRWFGVFWSSFVKMSVLYFLITYVWTYLVMRQVFQNRYLVLVLLIACESMTLILFSYWWYNPVTNMTVILYMASVAAVLLHPKNRWLWVSVCISLFLAALLKPNVSGMAIIGGTCSLLLSPRTRWRACTVSLIAFALWLGVVRLFGTSLTQRVGSYLAVSSRQFSNQQFLENFNIQEAFFAWACGFAVSPGIDWHLLA